MVLGAVFTAELAWLLIQSNVATESKRKVQLHVALQLGSLARSKVIRIMAYRFDFFTKPGFVTYLSGSLFTRGGPGKSFRWRWNAFDFMLVFLQLSPRPN